MKRKICALLIFTFILLFGYCNKVDAKEIEASDVPNNTYVIGTHMFTDEVVLTTQHIMLGATTIDSDKLEDMVIYYKTPWGTWWDGLTGDDLEAPTSFDVTNVDLDLIELDTPTLSNPLGHATGVVTIDAKLHIGSEGVYATEEAWNTISGWELYEKVGSDYVLVDTKEKEFIEVLVDAGETKTYVARVFAYNSKNEKVYSEYSNEYTITNNYEIEAPTLTVPAGTGDGIEKLAGFHIVSEGAYATEGAWDTISGWELYEKVGTDYVLVDTKERDQIEVIIAAGETKTYVARVFAYNSKNEKVYSEYSNEFTIDNTNMLESPILSSLRGGFSEGKLEIELSIFYDGLYEELYLSEEIVGFELYELIEDEYSLVDSNETKEAIWVAVDFGENKTYVARAYMYNDNNEKIYSDYSEEINLDLSQIDIPTLSILSGNNSEGRIDVELTIFSEGYYEDLHEYADEYLELGIKFGFELYEVNGEDYILVGSNETFEGILITSELGENITYVARAYVYNSKNEKIYSDYSEELKLDFRYNPETILKPTLLGVMGTSGSEQVTIFSEGAYVGVYPEETVIGFELYEVIDDVYVLVDSNEDRNGIWVTVGLGEYKTLVARAYMYNENNEKIYSEYSEEYTVAKWPETPILSSAMGTIGSSNVTIFLEGPYAELYSSEEIVGFELYEVTEDDYILVDSNETKEGIWVTVELGESKTYIALAYMYDENNEKVYSDYSNEFAIENLEEQ